MPNQPELNRRRRVLVVEDEPVNREMLGFILGSSYEVLCAEDGIEALDILKEEQETISLIMLDIHMPRMNGYDFLEFRQKDEALSLIPVIVLTSDLGSELKTLKMGASDYLTKPYEKPEIILARVDRLVELAESRRIIQSTERDPLTELYTKQYFFEHVHQREYFFPNQKMDVAALNIARFHLVNEIFGRQFGDHVLQEVAKIIKEFLSLNGGIASRDDADWFFIYFTHQEDYEAVMREFQEKVDARIPETNIRLRLGVYLNPDHSVDVERRCDQAKIACDTIRDAYTTSVAYYDTKVHADSLFQMRLINEVGNAIGAHQLHVYYQPKYDITGEAPRLKSAEALVRWIHPELGMISPAQFIPLFESNGLIQQVDFFVWREAGRQVREWRDRFGVSIPVSVNISRIDLYDPLLEEKLLGILEEYELTPEEYYLEITESAYVDDQDFIIGKVEGLKKLGFHIEMDDFGAGYSSLNMLTAMPVDVVKMDMKLMERIQSDPKSLHLVESIIELAHFMSMTLVAEGVEEKEQVGLLKGAGCDVIQGWYFSKPVPAAEFEGFIEKLLQAD